MSDVQFVENDEELYRSVRADHDQYYYDDDGNLIIRHIAFQDPQKKPSVDRAKLRNYQPEKTKKGDSDGVVSLITEEVRNIADVNTKRFDKKGKEIEVIEHRVDVKYDPIYEPIDEKNEAHALITPDPNYIGGESSQTKTFKRLQLALARLATMKGWTLRPKTE